MELRLGEELCGGAARVSDRIWDFSLPQTPSPFLPNAITSVTLYNTPLNPEFFVLLSKAEAYKLRKLISNLIFTKFDEKVHGSKGCKTELSEARRLHMESFSCC